MVINYKKLNPLGFHLLKVFQDPTIRQIILFGGSSSGKSYSVAEVFLLMSLYEGKNQLVMRKVGASIKDSIYASFKAAAEHLGISDLFQFKDGIKVIRCKENGAEIKFKGLDDSEKIKGLESIKRVFMDEWNEYEEKDYKQMKLRLRGMKGQQLVFAFNPIKGTHWIKKNVFDKEEWHDVSMEVELGGVKVPAHLTEVKSYRMNAPKTMMHKRTGEIIEHPSDMAVLQTTYLNNFWVVGSPDGTYGYYDDQAIATFEHDRIHDPDYYRVYALGEWGVIRTGSEYFHAFNRGQHCIAVEFDPSLPIHISVDNNRLPYISYAFWQIDYSNGIQLRQFHEICAGSPDNSAHKSAVLVAKYLRSIGYQDKVYLHGDCTTRNSNTIDDEGRSFLDKVISTLTDEGFEVVDKVSKSNPSVPMSGEFINAIYEYEFPDIRIFIDENCATSIEDYMSVQKDANGAILKTKVKNKITMQTYEEHGHLCFIPDTPVATRHGEIPIRDIKIGDEVLTEKGWMKVYNSLCSIRKSQYFSLTLNGRTLKCTYDHPIYTNRGFVPACDLKAGDEIIRNSNNEQWKEKLSTSTASDFIATLMENAKAIGSIIADGLGLTANSSKSISTAICGNSLMVRFLRDIVFIILMAITTIIHLTISPLCVLMSMRNSIQSFMASIHGRRLKKLLTIVGIGLLSGTHRKMGGNGIRKMGKRCGAISRCVSMSARYVVKPLKAIVRILRSSAQIAAKASGESNRVWTMKSVIARFVGLNLLSINTLRRSAVHGHVLLNIGGISDVYDISTSSHTFFANGILVHNSDTKRYIVCDILNSQFLDYSNKRKRNLYAKDNLIQFYNPTIESTYTTELVYCMPNVANKFVMVHGKKCGEHWHIVDVAFFETSSTEDIKQRLNAISCSPTYFEAGRPYYPFVRELRGEVEYTIKVLPEDGDIDRRIAATSDFVKSSIKFNESKMAESEEYAAFMTSLLDYNKDSQNKEASAVLSGFIKVAVKFFSNG